MNAPEDLDDLRRQWRSGAQAGLDVESMRRFVDADTRRHRWIIVQVGALNAAVLVHSAWRAVTGTGDSGWSGFLLALVYSVAVWLLAGWLVRGQRSPRDESTAAYLDVAIRRSRAIVLGAPLGVCLYALAIVAVIWVRHSLQGQPLEPLLRSGPMILSLWVVMPLYTLVMGGYALVHRRRLSRLRALQSALAGS
jgi:hypothetical protein